MDYMILSIILGTLLPFTAIFFFLIGDPIFRCKIMNKLIPGSFFGIVILDGWGSNSLFLVKNLKKDLLTIDEDVFIIDNKMILNVKKPSYEDMVLIKKDPSAWLLKEKKIKVENISTADIRNIGGVPFIELDKNNMIPIEKSVMKLHSSYKNMLPSKAQATLKTEVAIARAKAYNEGAEKLQQMLLIILILTVVGAGICGMVYMNQGPIGSTVNMVLNNTNQIKDVLILNVTG